MLLLLSSLSKHRQEGKRLTVCLVPYAAWQQSLTDMAGVWATATGSLFFFFIYFILFFLACACVLGRNVKRNHCLALTRLDSLSGCREGRSFDRYLCNILDGAHNRLALAAERKPSPAHIRLASREKPKIFNTSHAGKKLFAPFSSPSPLLIHL